MRGDAGLRESWSRIGSLEIHAWHAGAPGGSAVPLVAVLPGLGLPAYAVPTVRAVAAAGAECVLLDLPGFGEPGPPAVASNVEAVGRAAAQWLRRRGPGRKVVLLGHSTGAQAALHAALRIQQSLPHAALVLAGPTFMPPMRRPGPLVLTTPRAYREDSLRELRVLPALARGGTRVLGMLRSGMLDAPEQRIVRLRLGVTLTAGTADAFAPRWWLHLLRTSARHAAYARVVQTPGSHNNLFTHPEQVASVVVRALERGPAQVAGERPDASGRVWT